MRRIVVPDDPKKMAVYDRQGMFRILESFPTQCERAKALASGMALPRHFRTKYSSIVCAGMGGSAIGADILRSYLFDEADTPIVVNRSYTLPAFAGAGALVIVSSYSGDTEESLSAYRQAMAGKAKVVAVTSGGELERVAARDGVPIVKMPGGLPPRCALGYSLFSLLVLAAKIGLVKDKSREMDEAIRVLSVLRETKIGVAVSRGKNMAKRIAEYIFARFPVIYGSQDHIDSVVARWRAQLAENAKALSSSGLFPEMSHNEIEGWSGAAGSMKDAVVILLKDKGDHPRVLKRMRVAKKLIERCGAGVIEVGSFGSGLLARVLSLVYIGDYVSYYLAALNKVDPTPVEQIRFLKEALARA